MTEEPTASRWVIPLRWGTRKMRVTAIRKLVLFGCLLTVAGGALPCTGSLKKVAEEGLAYNTSYYNRSPEGPRLVAADLNLILNELVLPAQSTLSMWDRVRAWLRDLVGKNASVNWPEWLKDFRVSEATALWIFYVACALIVCLALGVVVNEVRHVRARRRFKAPADRNTANLDNLNMELSMAVDQIPLLDRPAWLLNRLIWQLELNTEEGTRPASMTHRQVVLAARTLPETQSTPLSELAVIAERIRYSPESPSTGEISEALSVTSALVREDIS